VGPRPPTPGPGGVPGRAHKGFRSAKGAPRRAGPRRGAASWAGRGTSGNFCTGGGRVSGEKAGRGAGGGGHTRRPTGVVQVFSVGGHPREKPAPGRPQLGSGLLRKNRAHEGQEEGANHPGPGASGRGLGRWIPTGGDRVSAIRQRGREATKKKRADSPRLRPWKARKGHPEGEGAKEKKRNSMGGAF